MSRVWQWGAEENAITPGVGPLGGSQSVANFSRDASVVHPGIGAWSGKFIGIGYVESVTGFALRQAYARVWARLSGLPAQSGTILGFNNAGDGAAWAYLRILPTGAVEIRINALAADLVATSAPLIVPNVWHRYEIFADIDGKLVASRVDGASWSGLRAAAFTTTGDLDRLVIGPSVNLGVTAWVDDAAVNSTIGLANSSWCGTDTIGLMVPTGDGPQLQWIAQNGGAHFAEVEDLGGGGSIDDATSYIKETAGAFGAADQFTVGPALPSGAVLSAVLYGIRGGGTGTDSRRAAVQGIDAAGAIRLGNQALNWDLNGWKSVYPALVAEEQWNGTHAMLTADYLNASRLQAVRYDNLAREIRFSALWASIAALTPGVVPTVPLLRDRPRVLVELGPRQ